MSLDQKDTELIERLITKHGDDIAVSIARSFERLEERINAAESRLYSRISGLEDHVGYEFEKGKDDLMDELNSLNNGLRAQTARLASDQDDTRRHGYKCFECDQNAFWTLDDYAEKGNPACGECGDDMKLTEK